MPNFEYRTINPKSGRKIKRQMWAYDQDELHQKLAEKGVEAFDIVVIPEPPATEPQLNLMRDRGIAIPHGLTKSDASSLISNFFDKREVASEKDFAVARILRVEVGRYDSKEIVYRHIFSAMMGRPMKDFAAWYAYRVYRSTCDRSLKELAEGPDDPRFQEIADLILADEKAFRSLRRAIVDSTKQFRWFGIYRASDGNEYQGDGNKTEIFRFTLNALRNLYLLSGDEVDKAGRNTGRLSEARQPRRGYRDIERAADREVAVTYQGRGSTSREQKPAWFWQLLGGLCVFLVCLWLFG